MRSQRAPHPIRERSALYQIQVYNNTIRIIEKKERKKKTTKINRKH